MQMFPLIEQEEAQLVGWGVQVLLLADPRSPATALVQRRIAGMGGQIGLQPSLTGALAQMTERPGDLGLVMICCDDFGGMETGRHFLTQLVGAGQHVPAILISVACRCQTFPESAEEPVLLRAPLSAVSLHVGVEHALRPRLPAISDA